VFLNGRIVGGAYSVFVLAVPKISDEDFVLDTRTESEYHHAHCV
jgi:hypothetical protein